MIIGECPYCEAPFELGMPEKTPAWAKLTCEACGRQFWEQASRVEPVAYTLEEFAELFVIDVEAHTIERRDGKPAAPGGDL